MFALRRSRIRRPRTGGTAVGFMALAVEFCRFGAEHLLPERGLGLCTGTVIQRRFEHCIIVIAPTRRVFVRVIMQAAGGDAVRVEAVPVMPGFGV